MRNTICAALTTITLALCTALAGCGSASEPSTPARAVRSIESQCSQDEDGGFRECVITLTDSGLRRLLGLQEGRTVMRLGPCERSGQGS